MRILSLLPAATETLIDLGLQNALVDGSLGSAPPDLILVPPDAHAHTSARAQVATLDPRTITDIFANIQTIGELTHTTPQAAALIQKMHDQLGLIQTQLAKASHHPYVCAILGLHPPRSPGLWIPEQIALAGGSSALGVAGEPGQAIEWDDIIHSQPELVAVMPCDATLAQAAEQIRANAHRPDWDDLPATHLNQIYAVDSAYFCIPGPRVTQGVEILAGLLHPHLCRHPLETEARRLTLDVTY